MNYHEFSMPEYSKRRETKHERKTDITIDEIRETRLCSALHSNADDSAVERRGMSSTFYARRKNVMENVSALQEKRPLSRRDRASRGNRSPESDLGGETWRSGLGDI
jgi:hypothetical protein